MFYCHKTDVFGLERKGEKMRHVMLWCAPLLALGLLGCVGEADPLEETETTVIDPGTTNGTNTTGTTGTTGTGTTGTTGTGTTGTNTTTGTTGTGTTGTGTTTTGTTGTSTTGTSTTVTGTTPDGMYANIEWRLHPQLDSIVYVEWDQARVGTGHIEYSFDSGFWEQTPTKTWGVGGHEQMLLGIPYDIDVTFRLAIDDGDGVVYSDNVEATTGDLPPNLPRPDLEVYDPDRYEPTGKYLMGSINQNNGGWTGGTYWKWIMDRKGRYVWAAPTPGGHWTIYMQTSYDGKSILWDEQTYWSDFDNGAGSMVFEMKIDGSITKEWSVPGEHHVFTQLADDSIVWGAVAGDFEDLMRLYPDGSTERIWRCRDLHNDNGVGGSCQSNTLFWNEPTDTFLFSFYTTSTAVEIDNATGETLRQWGDMRNSWDFDPPNSKFEWQHGLTYTDEGTLLLSTEVFLGGWDSETAVREYNVNDSTETLEEVWNYGLGRGVYGSTAGEAHRLPNGNTLHNYGAASVIIEVTNEKERVWEVEWSGSKLLGRTIFLDDLYAFEP
jgi:hypothetical protein